MKHVASLSISKHLQHCSQCTFLYSITHKQLIPAYLDQERRFETSHLLSGSVSAGGTEVHLKESMSTCSIVLRIFEAVLLAEPLPPSVVLPGANPVLVQPLLPAADLLLSLGYDVTSAGDIFL